MSKWETPNVESIEIEETMQNGSNWDNMDKTWTQDDNSDISSFGS